MTARRRSIGPSLTVSSASTRARSERLLHLLQGVVRASGRTQIEVDEAIGRRRGYLSHVFQGRVDLKVLDLLRVLAALEIDPSAFFAASVGEKRSAAQLLALQAAAAPRHPATTAAAVDQELGRRIEQLVRQTLEEMGGPLSPTR